MGTKQHEAKELEMTRKLKTHTVNVTEYWHYAPAVYLPKIALSGSLQPSNAGGSETETPLLWFSANQSWEPTATKMIRSLNGAAVQLTRKQQEETLGLVRFGLPANDPRFLTWRAACLEARIGRDERRAMERRGVKLGAEPAHWFAIERAVSLSELHLQVWEGVWRDAPNEDDLAGARSMQLEHQRMLATA
ncbi:MAG: hypothetical protein AB7E55_17870 [Pigmentiphaga sp.]